MQRSILIISQYGDLHADLVEQQLQQRGAVVFRLHLDQFPRDYQVRLNYANNAQARTIIHLPTGQELKLDQLGAVWLRKAAPFEFRSDDLSPHERAFAQAETEHLLYGVLFALDVFWFSHPLALRSAQWKGEQLQRAAAMGFRVPRSLITNDPEALAAFKRSFSGDMVFKAMSSPALAARDLDPEQREAVSLPTTRISDAEFRAGEWNEALEAVNELPGLFQEYIEKAYELRVTIIGQQLFAAKIHSQLDPRTATDYRDFSVEIPYEATTLEPSLAQRCVQFVRSYGLEYGAMDLIVTPENDVVFLENNPGGQFYFIEQLVPEFQLCATVAELLHTQAQRAAPVRIRAYA